MSKLGVNVDHVATVRQARGTKYPDPVSFAVLAVQAGADQITVHLREDRRHIQESDLLLLRRTLQADLNLEMALVPEMVDLAIQVHPDSVTLVPEKRRELTTEGGLDIKKIFKELQKEVPKLQKNGIRVSLFIHPDPEAIRITREVGADAIEIHTGRYAEALKIEGQQKELQRLRESALLGRELGLWVAAGHGLNYQNTKPVAQIEPIQEFNIGHAIIARSLFVGVEKAVAEMKSLIGG